MRFADILGQGQPFCPSRTKLLGATFCCNENEGRNVEKAFPLGRYHLCVRKGGKEKCENKASSDSWAKLGSVIRKKLSARTFGPELVPNMPAKKPRGNGEEEASN